MQPEITLPESNIKTELPTQKPVAPVHIQVVNKFCFVPEMSLHDVETFWYKAALEKWPNKTECAEKLGCTIKTLYNKIHEFGLFDQYKVNHRRSA